MACWRSSEDCGWASSPARNDASVRLSYTIHVESGIYAGQTLTVVVICQAGRKWCVLPELMRDSVVPCCELWQFGLRTACSVKMTAVCVDNC